MHKDSIKLIEMHLEKSLGEIGARIYKKCISKVNNRQNPSRNEIDNLVLDIEKSITLFHGTNRSKAIIDELRMKLLDLSFECRIKETLDELFSTVGIPDESEIKNIARNLSKSFSKDEKLIAETVKGLSREKIVSAMNTNIINSEIKSFFNRCSTYTKGDFEDFINYMKANKFNVNESYVKEIIEKERLFRKFGYTDVEEDEIERVTRQYITLLNSNMKKNYDYIFSHDDELARIAKKIIVKTDSEYPFNEIAKR